MIFDQNNILYCRQFGFRRDESNNDAVFEFRDRVSSAVDGL